MNKTYKIGVMNNSNKKFSTFLIEGQNWVELGKEINEKFGDVYEILTIELIDNRRQIIKYIECKDCKHIYDCERTYLGGCTDGEEWSDTSEEKNDD